MRMGLAMLATLAACGGEVSPVPDAANMQGDFTGPCPSVPPEIGWLDKGPPCQTFGQVCSYCDPRFWPKSPNATGAVFRCVGYWAVQINMKCEKDAGVDAFSMDASGE
jgi:hypothetical protein